MTEILTIVFWFAAGAVIYTFLVYPLIIALLASLRSHVPNLLETLPDGVSIVVAARNEQENIHRRLAELIEDLSGADFASEIILVSDGSTDATVSIAHAFEEKVIAIDLPQNLGKSAALNEGVAVAKQDVIVFADARQRWTHDAVPKMLEAFRDPAVGAVSGELVLESASGVLAGVGSYWKFEKWLRRQEAAYDSQIGVTGAICAVRRSLFSPIPAGILLDDVYWPMQVALQGYRVTQQPTAKAYDRLPKQTGVEMRRKLRTLVGNYQLMATCPELLLPWRNRLWFQFVSHKVLRLLTPWALLAMLISSTFLLENFFYQVALVCQLLGVLAGVIGLSTLAGSNWKVLSAAGSFLLLQLAAWLAFWYWIFGRTQTIWENQPLHLSTADSQN